MNIIQRHKILTLGFFTLLIAVPVAALCADQPWILYESPSGAFSVKFPEKPESNPVSFMVDDSHVVYAEESTASIHLDSKKSPIKNYVVKFNQTLGPKLTSYDVIDILQRDFKAYEDFYKSREGVLRQKIDTGINGSWGGEIMISYKDPTYGDQTVRARFLYNETTKLEQIVIGSENIMNLYQTRDYYDSLRMKASKDIVKEMLTDRWNLMESPTNMYSVLYPELVSPYFPADPVSKWDDKSESTAMYIYDPVRDEKVFFTIYGYRFNTEIDYKAAQEVLVKKITSRLKPAKDDMALARGVASDPSDPNKFPFIETTYQIKAPPGFPYLDYANVQAFFTGNTMIAIEILGSKAMMQAPIVRNIKDHVIFHPNQMREPMMPKLNVKTLKPESGSAAPELKSLLPEEAQPADALAPRPAPSAAPTTP